MRNLSPQRAEIRLRILLQNVNLMLAVSAFAFLAAAALAWPLSAWLIACVHAIVSGALLLQWCHHGVRTMQLKMFLMQQEEKARSDWEVWLPANRPKRLLGTRWFVSTKGVFLGTQAAMAGFAILSAETGPLWAQVACASAFLVSAGLLLTNPKE